MASSKKRKADEIERYTCFTCTDNKPARQFPDYNPSPDCEHLINTCKNCLRKWVEANVDDANFTSRPAGGESEGGVVKSEDGVEKSVKPKEVWGVSCPQCEGIMRAVNVQMAVPKKIWTRFDELERKHIGDTTPNWRWCLAPGCRAGQVHEPKQAVQEPPAEAPKRAPKAGPKKASKPAKYEPEPVEVPYVCVCHDCGARACVRCDRPMHDGETCADYQARVKDRLDEEDKALKAVRNISRPCPGCSKNIQKNGGCANMICSQCGKQFYWV